jgi:hypothetical protein
MAASAASSGTVASVAWTNVPNRGPNGRSREVEQSMTSIVGSGVPVSIARSTATDVAVRSRIDGT